MRRFKAMLASGAALIGAAVYFTTAPSLVTFLFVVAWQIVFFGLAFLILWRPPS